MRPSQYEEIVLKAMAHIKANITNSVTVPDIAKAAGFSERHIRNAFKKILNQSIIDVLQDEKLSKAKSLLLGTNLGVSKVALESGFESYANFARVFRDRIGLTPMAFRQRTAELKEIPIFRLPDAGPERKEEWYKDPFAGEAPGPNWKPIGGEWRNESGALIGTGIDSHIAFLKPLPENCLISFEAMLSPIPDFHFPSIGVGLTNEMHNKGYCVFTIPSMSGSTGTFAHVWEGSRWNSDARILEGEWHSFSLKIREDTVCFSINDEEVFSVRHSLPMAYSDRCCLQLAGWHGQIRIRKFTIQNLGFTAVIHPIRRGDALYGAGLIEKAMEFYMRYLQAGSLTDAETMELRYKIGMCHLKLDAYSQAQAWIEKVVILRDETFWADRARLAFLDLCWKTRDIESLKDHMSHCIEDPKTRDQCRVTVQRIVDDFRGRGFFDEAISVLTTWSNLEKAGDYARQRAQSILSGALLEARKHADAEMLLKELVRSPVCEEIAAFARIDLMQLYQEWGKIEKSEGIRKEIESGSPDQENLVRCAIHHALNLRAKDKLQEALDILTGMPNRFGGAVSHLLSQAKFHSGIILCCLGRLAEGRKMLGEVFGSGEGRDHFYLAFYLAEKDYKSAAEAVLRSYQTYQGSPAGRAYEGICAGILYELCGFVNEAQSIFDEVSVRFPVQQVRFLGSLGHFLAKGGDLDVAEMPYEADRRSQVFYLIGLLYEKRGDKGAAQRLLKASVKEDPTLRWPAYFARQKLTATTK